MPPWLLALDFGGTKHSAARLTPGQRAWDARQRTFSPPGADRQTDIRIMVDMARSLLDGATPAAIGVSFGGPVDFASGRVRLSHHVPGWEDTPLQQILEDEFGAPAGVDNDANIAALGEQRFGAGQGYSSLLYITVSTGVGGGWILDGRPWRGGGSLAGEIGHTSIDPHGPVCLCGKRGCVERFASGPYMAKDARERLANLTPGGPGHILVELAGGDLNAITGQTISQAAGQGDELALDLLDRSAWALGVAIGNAANLVNPQRFILGGGVTKSGERWWNTIRRVARATALPEIEFSVAPAALGDDAPLWGAAALAADLLSGRILQE